MKTDLGSVLAVINSYHLLLFYNTETETMCKVSANGGWLPQEWENSPP